MGLSLSVLVAICFLLPGAAFLFGLARLHNPNSPGIGIEQYLSVSLATAILAAIGFQGVWLILWIWLTHLMSMPAPDPAQFASLLGGELAKAKGPAALESLSSYPGRICAYFFVQPFLSGLLGRWVNSLIKGNALASWYELLTPRDAIFVWLTAEIHMDGTCYLFAGPVKEFSVSKDGNLERVVLSYAVRRPLTTQVDSLAEGTSVEAEWKEISGERTILVLNDSKTINLDYFYEVEDQVEWEGDAENLVESGDDDDDDDDGDGESAGLRLPHWAK